MKNLNILFVLIISFMIMSAIGCSNANNPMSPQPSERVIYYAEINDTMAYARDSGYYYDTLYGNFDFTRSDSIKVEYTYLTNTQLGEFFIEGRIGDTFQEYRIKGYDSISDSTYHTASGVFKAWKRKLTYMRIYLGIRDREYIYRYTILKDIKITEK